MVAGVFLSLLSFLVLFSSGCAPPPEGDRKTVILSYNVQNIFDAELDGSEYEEFREGWSDSLYHVRLERLSKVIRQTSPPPDLVVLQEVEDRDVLDELCTVYLSEYGYSYRIVGGPEESATQVGLLTHLPVLEVRRHAPPEGDHPLRNVLEVRVDLGGEELVILGNHWKSRAGGGDEGRRLRRETARMVRLRLDALLSRDPQLPIVLAGDFNSEAVAHWVDSEAPLLLDVDRPDAIPVSESLSGSAAEGFFFSPWELAPGEGSYYYRELWERIDAFYLSPALAGETGPHFESFSVHPWRELRHSDGTPLRWITDLETGFSDHLPILLVIANG